MHFLAAVAVVFRQYALRASKGNKNLDDQSSSDNHDLALLRNQDRIRTLHQ
jgi:hypothetical protein